METTKSNRGGRSLPSLSQDSAKAAGRCTLRVVVLVAPVAYQVILEPGIGQFREFEPPRVHTRI